MDLTQAKHLIENPGDGVVFAKYLIDNPEKIIAWFTLIRPFLKSVSGLRGRGRTDPSRTLREKRTPSNTISSYVLGFYLPWLFVGRSIPESEINDNPEVKWDIDTTESYILEAASELKIGIDKEYVYNIRSKPLVEKYSVEKKLLDHGLPEEVVSAFRFGVSLSESYVMFDDEESRYSALNEAESYALGIEVFNREAINKFLTELRKKSEKQDFGEKIDEFSAYLINTSLSIVATDH